MGLIRYLSLPRHFSHLSVMALCFLGLESVANEREVSCQLIEVALETRHVQVRSNDCFEISLNQVDRPHVLVIEQHGFEMRFEQLEPRRQLLSAPAEKSGREVIVVSPSSVSERWRLSPRFRGNAPGWFTLSFFPAADERQLRTARDFFEVSKRADPEATGALHKQGTVSAYRAVAETDLPASERRWALWHLAYALNDSGRLEEILPILDELDRSWPERPEMNASVRSFLAFVLMSLGRYDEAKVELNQLLRLLKEEGARGNVDLSFLFDRISNNLCLIRLYERDLADVEQCFLDFLEDPRRYPDAAFESLVLNNIGGSFQLRQEGSTAERFFTAALERARDANATNRILQAHSNLGLNLRRRGLYRDSIVHYLAALRLQPAQQETILRARLFSNLGKLYQALGAQDRARVFLEDALQLRQTTQDSHSIAASYDALGQLAFDVGNYELARSHHTEALSRFAATGDTVSEARNRLSLGRALRKLNEDVGDSEIANALASAREAGDLDVIAEARVAQAEVLFAGKALLESAAHLEEAIAHFDAVGLGVEAIEARVLLAEVHRERGAFPEATRTVDLNLDHISLLSQQLDHRTLGPKFQSLNGRVFHQAVALAMSADDPNRAFLMTERYRQVRVALADTRNQQGARVATEVLGETVNRLSEAVLAKQAPGQSRRDYYQALLEIETAAPRGASSIQPLPDVDVMSASLPEGSAAISFFVSDETMYRFTLTTGGMAVVAINDAAQLMRDVSSVTDDLKRPDSTLDLAKMQAVCTVLLPLDVLKNMETLYVVLDRQLHYLPVEALQCDLNWRDRVQNAIGGWFGRQDLSASYRPLIQSLSVARLQSVSDLLDHSERTSLADIPLTLVTYSPDSNRNVLNLPPLLWADTEADRIQAIYSGSVNRLATEAATFSNVLNRSATPRSLLHIAAHGLVDPVTGDLGGLVLSAGLGGSGSNNETGFVSNAAISSANLSAELVYLSACDTADGTLTQGSGLLNTARSFNLAGVPRVIASLWSMDDRVAADLAIEFYESLQNGLSPVTALSEAKRRVARQQARHPYYWSGLQLSLGPRL